MKVLDRRTEKSVLTVTILIEPDEFTVALEKAYQDHREKYRVPGWQGGKAPRAELERVYGPDVLYAEALDRTIPILYGKFVSANRITQAGQPEIVDVSWRPDGGAAFTVRADVYPAVHLGQYKWLAVRTPSISGPEGDSEEVHEKTYEEALKDAVLDEAARRIEVDIPEGMIKRKLDALTAQEKLRINQEAIYNVLANTVYILDKAYRAAGVARPLSQVRQEAMDVMLQSVSADHGDPSVERFSRLLTESVRLYRELPPGFAVTLEQIILEREQEQNKMKPEERVNEVFAAYLGSLNITEEAWRAQHWSKAAGLVRRDLLLDAVAEAEKISVTAEEMEAAYLHIAEQCGVDAEQVKAEAGAGAVEWQLRREKAARLIVDSAVH
ncbi:MAG TPA: trigger factor [Anaerovoracaceae bacterium]|nr:trigger factor [Anaerovoracaceae bacterium]